MQNTRGKTNEYGIQRLKFDFLYVCPLVSNEICANFHCKKMNKFENNIVLNVPTHPTGKNKPYAKMKLIFRVYDVLVLIFDNSDLTKAFMYIKMNPLVGNETNTCIF